MCLSRYWVNFIGFIGPLCYIHSGIRYFNYYFYDQTAVVRLLRITMNNNHRLLKLVAIDHSTLQAKDARWLATISLLNSSQGATSPNNLLAYRPRFNDLHGSGLAAIFINLEGVFPCLEPLHDYYPICHVFTDEEDGFRDGRAVIDSGDDGRNFRIFNSSAANILTYGIAIHDCPEFNTTCFPTYHSFSVACYLPRAACSSA